MDRRTRTTTILAGAAVVVICLVATEAMAKSDKEFLSDAIKTDNAEIALGKLAAKQGGSADVKSFAQTLVSDHTKARQAAVALAPELQVKPVEGVPLEARNEQAKLKGLKGNDFDKEFAAFMVTGHKQAIAEFKDKAAEGDRPVSTLAKQTLPTLEMHLSMAEKLAGTPSN
jgi:putative membrane protein